MQPGNVDAVDLVHGHDSCAGPSVPGCGGDVVGGCSRVRVRGEQQQQQQQLRSLVLRSACWMQERQRLRQMLAASSGGTDEVSGRYSSSPRYFVQQHAPMLVYRYRCPAVEEVSCCCDRCTGCLNCLFPRPFAVLFHPVGKQRLYY